MRRVGGEAAAPFRALLEAYNRCFLDRDLEGLRALYASDGDIVYFDNHPACDSAGPADHLAKVGAFFAHGKSTESGTVEPLIVEDFAAFAGEAAAVITAITRYAGFPVPGVRDTFVLQAENGAWRIRHIHFSFDPNEQKQDQKA